jgi:hypothetical protein
MYRPDLSLNPSFSYPISGSELFYRIFRKSVTLVPYTHFLSTRFVKIGSVTIVLCSDTDTNLRLLLAVAIYTKQYTMCMYQTRIYCFAPECVGPNWSSWGEMANWGHTFTEYP